MKLEEFAEPGLVLFSKVGLLMAGQPDSASERRSIIYEACLCRVNNISQNFAKQRL